MASRNDMEKAIKSITLPQLRAARFKGSFPHLRRITDEGAYLITFQYNRYGGSFVVEIARCFPEGIVDPRGRHIPASEIRTHDRHPSYRPRLSGIDGEWFDFEKRSPEVIAIAITGLCLDEQTWLPVPRGGSETPYK